MVSSCSMRSCQIWLVAKKFVGSVPLTLTQTSSRNWPLPSFIIIVWHAQREMLWILSCTANNRSFLQYFKRKAEERRLACVFVWTMKSWRRRITHDSSWKSSLLKRIPLLLWKTRSTHNWKTRSIFHLALMICCLLKTLFVAGGN